MLKKISDATYLLVFSLFFFVLLPGVKADFLIDIDLAPKHLLSSIFLVLLSSYFLLKEGKTVEISKEALYIFYTALGILTWMAICIFRSINTGDAFYEITRIAVLYSVLVLSYLVLIKSRDALKIISRCSSVGVIIFCFVGIVQLYPPFIDFLEGRPYYLTSSAWSTLSNKNFFSEVLVLFLPLLIVGIIYERKFWRTVILFALFLNVCFIILLQTISAWIAILSATIFFAFLIGIKKVQLPGLRMTRKTGFYILGITAMIFVMVYFVYKDTSNYKILQLKIVRTTEYWKNPELLSMTRDENNNSVFERLVIWRNSLKMIADYPLLGAGLNNWKLLNPSYGIGGTMFTNSGFVNYEHPHNDYLLIFSEEGIIGFLLYLLFFYLIIQSGLKKINSSEPRDKLLLSFLLAGILAFMILSFFGYPRSRFYSMVMLMILTALILAAGPVAGKRVVPLRGVLLVIILISIGGTITSLYRIYGEMHTKNMMVFQLNRNYARMIREADKAYSWIYPMDLTATPISWYKGLAYFYSNHKEEAIVEYEKAIKINPNHLRLLNDLATSYEQTGNREKAIYYYKKAISIIPMFLEANLNLSAAYYNSGNTDSSFYYIDRIYSVAEKMDGKANYNKYLDAILFAKAMDLLLERNDSVLTRSLTPLVENKDSLNQIYKRSKEENQPFAKYLIDFTSSN
jgi:O-antigen ligase